MYVTTPFPYANGLLHMGHLAIALRSDAIAALLRALNNKEVSFHYSIHLTGLPVALRLEKYHTSTLSDDGLSLLEKYKKENTVLTKIDHWYQLMKTYYQDLFNQLKIRSRLQEGITHTTTDLDENYSKWVRAIFRALKKENRLVSLQLPTPECEKCKIVLGDHERASYEGIGVKTIMIKVENAVASALDPNEDLLTTLRKATLGAKEIALSAKTHSWVCSVDQLQWGHLQEGIYPLSYISRAVTCRCGGKAVIRTELKECLSFHDPQWKARTIALINKSVVDPSVKEIAISAVNNYGPKPYARTKGFGTRLEEGFFPDSLADSALHFLYYKVFEKDENAYAIVHLTGKDLITSHLVYAYYFLDPSLLKAIAIECEKERIPMMSSLETLPLVYFKVYGHIKSKDNEKMSKSLGNTISWNDLCNDFDEKHLRAYFYSRAEGLQDEPFDTDKLKQAYHSTIKNITRTAKKILSLNVESTNLANQLLTQHFQNLSIVELCKLREVNEFLLNGFRNLIDKYEAGSNSDNGLLSSYQKLIHCLYPSINIEDLLCT